MPYTITRKNPDGSITLVAYVDDQLEIGMAIDEDRDKIDFEPEYQVSKED